MSNFSIFFSSGQKKLLRVWSESTRVEAGLASYLLRAHLYTLYIPLKSNPVCGVLNL